MKKDKKLVVLVAIVLLLVILDQGIKLYSLINLKDTININSIIIYEEGTSIGGQTSLISYIVSNIIVLGIIIKFFASQKDRIDMNLVIIIAFLLAGGISNLIDKIATGNIINYIKILNMPAFNLSFILIAIGWIGLASIFAWNTYKEFNENKETKNK